MEDSESHKLLSQIMTTLADIDKDVDFLRYGNGEKKMSDSAVPFMMGANMGRGNDAALWAMQNQWCNNPFMYLILLAMFGNGFGGFGNWGGNGAAAAAMNSANAAETTNLLMNAINNAGATSQRDFDRMASNFGVTASQLSNGLQAVNTSIQQVACGVGTSAQQVINAIQNGNAGVMQAVQSACCENRLAICQQTNTLQQGQYQLGVTMERQGEMIRNQQVMLAKDAEIRALQNEVGILRDAAQTATLQGNIAAGDAAIMNKLVEIKQSLQTQITAQGYQLQQMQAKTATTGA